MVLSGTGTASVPWLQLDSSALDFGSVTDNVPSAAQNLTVTNAGDAPLHISSIALTGANAGDFTVNGGTGVTVAAGGSVVVSIVFTPSATGSRSASLTITSDAAKGPVSVGLTGSGMAPVVIPHPVASISPAAGRLRLAAGGHDNGTQVFLLQNTGTAPLTVGSVALAGANPADFAVVADGWSGAQLAPGQVARTLSLRFTPTATGGRSANLITDDAAGSPQLLRR